MVQRYKILLILIAKNKLFCIFAPKRSTICRINLLNFVVL